MANHSRKYFSTIGNNDSIKGPSHENDTHLKEWPKTTKTLPRPSENARARDGASGLPSRHAQRAFPMPRVGRPRAPSVSAKDIRSLRELVRELRPQRVAKYVGGILKALAGWVQLVIPLVFPDDARNVADEE